MSAPDASAAPVWLRPATPAPPPPVSVVVPTYQRRPALGRLLDALARQEGAADGAFEVVVVADGSTDGTRELLAAYAAPYPLLALWKPNGGRAAACNAGVRAARGELVALLDDDMTPAPGFVAAHRAAHARAAGRGERVAVVGAAPVTLEPGAPPAAAYVRRKFDAHLALLARPGHAMRLRDFYSGNCSIRRDVLLAVGLFDEAFRAYGNEDLELFVRLAAAGVRCEYAPGALARQGHDKSLAQLARDSEAKGRTAVLLARKHPGARPALKLGQMERERPARRLALAALARLCALAPGAPLRVTAALERLGLLRSPAGHRWYALALDHHYLLGARAAERESPAADAHRADAHRADAHAMPAPGAAPASRR